MTAKRERWSDECGDWFRDVIERAGIMDYRYPVKGCGVWLPFGFKLRQNIIQIMRSELDSTGHEEMLFPTLVPEDLLAKEAQHIKSFESESYWVTLGGNTPLDVKLALRPTSETVITPMAKLWIRSHADLPKVIYQIASIFRYETKATRPLIRVREVSTFKEAHSFHATHEDAMEQNIVANEVYKRIFDQLKIPYLISIRPEWDKFAGALTSYAFDTVFPDGRTLQIGTTHDLGQNFGKAFDVTFETLEGKREYVWQTSYGISERIVAAVIAIHGDDNGLVLPPAIAPTQVVIVPIPRKDVGKQLTERCDKAKKELEDAGLRVKLDDRREVTPGSKFFEWELKGVPVRVEIGPQDLARNEVTLVRRDTSERSRIPTGQLSQSVKSLMEEIERSVGERAWKWLQDHVHRTDSLKEAKRLTDKGEGVVEIPWCGSESCGNKIETETDAKILGVPYEKGIQPLGSEKCTCTAPAKHTIRLARSY